MNARDDLRRLREELKLLRALMGDLWELGDWVGIVWQSKGRDMDNVIVARYRKDGKEGFVVHKRRSGDRGLYVDFGDPDMGDKLRAEVRRLLDD